MIKRSYFMRFRKFAGDGTGTYFDNSFISTTRSFFADESAVMDQGREFAAEHLKEKPGSSKPLCMAFNRL